MWPEKHIKDYPDIERPIIEIQPSYEKCMMEEFHKQQQEKPPWLRSSSALLVCNCSKCRKRYIT